MQKTLLLCASALTAASLLSTELLAAQATKSAPPVPQRPVVRPPPVKQQLTVPRPTQQQPAQQVRSPQPQTQPSTYHPAATNTGNTARTFPSAPQTPRSNLYQFVAPAPFPQTNRPTSSTNARPTTPPATTPTFSQPKQPTSKAPTSAKIQPNSPDPLKAALQQGATKTQKLFQAPATAFPSAKATSTQATTSVASFTVSQSVKQALAAPPSGLKVSNAASTKDGYLIPKGSSLKGPAAQQCAVLVEALHPELGNTANWYKGQSVTQATPPGTAIATFATSTTPAANINRYPDSGQFNTSTTSPNYAHSAIVIGPGPKGSLKVLEQHEGLPATINIWPADRLTKYSTITSPPP